MGDRGQLTIASGINAIAGIWLIVAPFLLGYSDDSDNALWNDVIIGIAILVIAAIRVFGAYRAAALSWLNAVLGAWLILAPFILDYSEHDTPLWNDIIVGVIVLVAGAWSALASPTDRTTVKP